MDFVKATSADLTSVRALYRDVIDQTPQLDQHARWKHGLYPTDALFASFIEDGSMYLLADGGTVVAAMAMSMGQEEDYHEVPWQVDAADDEVAVIHLLAVRPSRQGQGLASRMIDEAVRLAQDEGKRAVRLDALATNTPAQRLYASKGFQPRGRQNLYAENTGWTDFLFFERAT
ncbi:MAG: GNAT family N-acetyltransferase [Atopobiaceae bacterium]|jgi:ribosomal protein S18 acetylase RimI-like enzyme|nr:GNAT family N-acetyltransferase [Atopobiaceae bacterium]